VVRDIKVQKSSLSVCYVDVSYIAFSKGLFAVVVTVVLLVIRV